MCNFFSFVTNPDHDKNYYYFDWQMRQSDKDGADSHSHICAHFKLNEDKCNKYEYNPLTMVFKVDMQNAEKDDRRRAKRWVESLDWKMIVDPLIVKPIVNPFDLPKVDKPTDEQVSWLKDWSSVWDSVRASVGASVGASVRDSVRASVGASVWTSVWDSVGASVRSSVRSSVWDSVRDSVRASVRSSVWDSVRDSVWDSVRDSVRSSVWDSVRDSVRASVRSSVWDSVRDSVRASVYAYVSSFFVIEYQYDFSPAIKLWEAGLVPSFDGKTWRLHSGKDADVVYKQQPESEVKGE
jgi:hypothetical protein